MAKSLEEYLQENPTVKLSDADMALGRQNYGALETIVKARKDWANATTAEEKDNAHRTAENIRKFYGSYSGGADGMEGQYSPTYVKPAKTANNDNVDALFNKYNEAYKGAAPTYTPKYKEEIADILDRIGNREPFSYNMSEDSNYQQYRDQYIREGQKAMKDTAAQTAALTGGYGSTYGGTAAQQSYDNYLEQLNDKVPQLEQMAYSRWADDRANDYNQLSAYQGEENRLYQQYLDALGQYNTDRNFTYGAMQDAVTQNNYENQLDRSIFESDRGYDRDIFENDRNYDLNKRATDLNERTAAINAAMTIGDYSKLKELGYDTSYLDFLRSIETAQGNATLAALAGAGTTGGSSGGSSGGGRSSGGKSSGRKSSKKSKTKTTNTTNTTTKSNNAGNDDTYNEYTLQKNGEINSITIPGYGRATGNELNELYAAGKLDVSVRDGKYYYKYKKATKK